MEIEKVKQARRISIIGTCGTGKSTLAVKLGNLLSLPVHHCDCIHLKPNYEKLDKYESYNKILEITKSEKWIIDGNYKGTLEKRFKLSDIVIFLDYDKQFCIDSVYSRNRKNEVRLGMPDYLQYDKENNPEYLVAHINNFPQTVVEYIEPLSKKYPNKLLIFKTREQLESWLRKMFGSPSRI